MTNVKPDVAPNGRYSQAEAARLLGASRKTLYRWQKDGRLRPAGVRPSGRCFFSGSEILRAWMEN